MDLTDREIALIRDSFAALKADRSGVNPFGEAFYGRVFELMPEARSLFREDMAAQGMQFLSTLHVLVDHLEDAAAVDRETANLGRGHAAFGVTPEMYAPMGQALAETMRAMLGDRYDAETETAWRKAYDSFAARMQGAAAA